MRKAVILAIGVMSLAIWACAQTSGQPAQSTTPATGQTPATGTPGAPATKRPPQAKTQPEFDAYKAAVTATDPATACASRTGTALPNCRIASLQGPRKV